MVWEKGDRFTLNICAIAAEARQRAQSMEKGMESVSKSIRQGCLALFAAGEEVVAKGIERFAARAV